MILLSELVAFSAESVMLGHCLNSNNIGHKYLKNCLLPQAVTENDLEWKSHSLTIANPNHTEITESAKKKSCLGGCV